MYLTLSGEGEQDAPPLRIPRLYGSIPEAGAIFGPATTLCLIQNVAHFQGRATWPIDDVKWIGMLSFSNMSSGDLSKVSAILVMGYVEVWETLWGGKQAQGCKDPDGWEAKHRMPAGTGGLGSSEQVGLGLARSPKASPT